MIKQLDDLADGPIGLGNEAVIPFGFTAARFHTESIMWKHGKSIYLTHVRPRSPGAGHLKHLLHGLLLEGYTVKKRNPFLDERVWCEANGFYETSEREDFGSSVSVWILRPEGSAMACPTCDHTMQVIANACWWCPRCGTLRQTTVAEQRAEAVPRLVERVTEFAGKLTEDHEDLIAEFERLGIRESITTLPM